MRFLEHALVELESTKVNAEAIGEITNVDMNWEEKEKEEDFETICCAHIKISSTGKVQAMYPFILGDYMYINSSTYIKQVGKLLYLTKPEPTALIWGYTWGVSLSAKAKWGYIRSGYNAPCPTIAGMWTVFDKITRRWVVDTTLHLECTAT